MAEAETLPAWRQENEKYTQDVIQFWQRLAVLPPDADLGQRARQLGAVAYVDGALVGVTSVSVEEYKPVRERFGFYRVLVDPAFRGQDLVPGLVDTTWHALEAWSLAHPDRRLAGMASVRQNADLIAKDKRPISPLNQLALTSYSPNGHQVRMRWFDHFLLR